MSLRLLGFRVINVIAMNNIQTKHANNAPATPGFSCTLLPATQLVGGMLIAEDEEGNYEPVGQVGSVEEAKGIAANDMAVRTWLLKKEQDAGLCPYIYKVFARGFDGRVKLAASWGVA